MTKPVRKPAPRLDDSDAPIIQPPGSLTVEDGPMRIVLADGRTWRRQIGFCAARVGRGEKA